MAEESTFEALKVALQEKDAAESSRMVRELYLKNPDKFRKGLLLSGCLPDPLSRSFKKEFSTIAFFDNICEMVEILFQSDNEKVAKEFRTLTSKICSAIVSIYRNLSSNEDRLMKNQFLDYPFAKQIQMWCTFLENQARYAERETLKTIRKQRLITGLEQEVATLGNFSVHDVLEAGYEIFDTLIRFLHFRSGKHIEESAFEVHTDVSPYEIPSIEELQYLATQRFAFNLMWEKIKYRNWDFSGVRQGSVVVAYCQAPNKEGLKKEQAAIYRYHNHLASISNTHLYVYNKISSNIVELLRSFDFVLDDPKTIFKLEVDSFNKVADLFGSIENESVSSVNEILGERYETIKLGARRSMSVPELIKVIIYLKTMGLIYQRKSFDQVADKNVDTFRYLAPVFGIDDLSVHFSKMYELELDHAKELIELFVFRPKPLLDVFAQPLIYLGHEKVVFTPALMDQMNSARIIEQHLSKWKVDVSSKGSTFEQNVRSALDSAPNVQVCLEPIAFKAYDGKNVEFDIIATFDDKIMLIELKCLYRPYSPYDMKLREDAVLYGVEQVNRRAEVLKRQWERVKEKVDIALPDSPPQDKDIIKIVCLNIFDFTGRVEDDVYVTDVSSLIRFFKSPEIYKYEYGENVLLEELVEVLWVGKPQAEELIQFLKAPVAMRRFYENLVETPRPIIRIKEEDTPFAMQDFIITSNPHIPLEEMSIREVRKKKGQYQKSLKKKKAEKKDRKKNRRKK